MGTSNSGSKFYFAGSIRAGRKDAVFYADIVALLSRHGTVLTEHVANPQISSCGERLDERAIHDRDLNWLCESRLMVAEVTTPSLGVGYEIARAVQLEKPVLCLFRPEAGNRLSAMIKGCPGVTIAEYHEVAELEPILTSFLS